MLTNDKDESKGRISNALDRIFDEVPQHKGDFVVFELVIPKDTPKVTSVDGIMFAVVQANSVEAFVFTFKQNANFGKVRPTNAMSNEWGDVTENFGRIDTCSIEATKMSHEEMALVRDEIEKAKDVFGKNKANKKSAGVEDKLQTFGKAAVEMLKTARAKTTT